MAEAKVTPVITSAMVPLGHLFMLPPFHFGRPEKRVP